MIKKESQVIACKVSHSALQGLYSMGLVRLDVPISGEDYIVGMCAAWEERLRHTVDSLSLIHFIFHSLPFNVYMSM